MKQMEVTTKVVGENTYYIRPFPAFTSVHISAELSNVCAPLLGGASGIANGMKGSEENVMDMELDKVLPSISAALSGLSADKLEQLMRKLLINYGNVSVCGSDTDGKTMLLSYDLANEIFCGDIQDMFVLCLEVVKVNFKGFFKKIVTRFGDLLSAFQTNQVTKTTDNSTQAGSQNSN